MNADRILALKLVGDVSSINKSLKQSQGRLRSFGASVGSWTRAAGIGLAIEGVAKLGDALGDAWTGFREGEKASAQLGTTWGNLNVKGADLQGTIDEISALSLKLGTDDTEAIKAFNTALLATGGKPAQAMDRLRIAQDLVANGSAPNLQSALKLIQGAANGSARVVDKFGLQSKTAAGRVAELGRKVAGAAKKAGDADPLARALNSIGEALEIIVGAVGAPVLAEFAKLMEEQIAPAVQKFADVFAENPIAAQVLTLAAAVGVLAAVSMAHPILALAAAIAVLSVVGAVAIKDDWLGQFNQRMSETREAMRGNDQNVDKFSAAMVRLSDFATTVFGPLLTPIFSAVGAAWNLAIAAINLDLGGFVAGLGQLAWSGFSLLLAPFQIVWGLIKGGFSLMGVDVDKSIGDLVANLGTMGGEALKAAQTFGDNIYRGIVSGVQRMAAAVVSTWNSLGKFPAGGFTFAEAFEIDVLGQKVGWPKIAINWGAGDIIPNIGGGGGGRNQLGQPMAKGGIVMPTPGGTLARIGEAGKAEAVIPLDRLGGMGGDSYVINVYAHPTSDPAEMGRVVVEAIRSFRNRGGGPAIRAAVA